MSKKNKTKLPNFNIILIILIYIIFTIPLVLMCILISIFGGYKPFKLFMTLPFNYIIWRENVLDDFNLIECDEVEKEL